MFEDFLDRRGPVALALPVLVFLAGIGVLVFMVVPRIFGSDDGGEITSTLGSADASDGPIPAEDFVSSLTYESNLEMLKAASIRNANHDDSPFLNTPSDQLNPENHYGPRVEHIDGGGANPEPAFPVIQGGQFRAGCEFSHFSYDDPLIFPGRPGASHLHMHFGNTDINAFSTFDTLLNSGSSTCNGQELNRTGYWVPAMFDGDGNVRIPERVVVYYKGEGNSRGQSIPYPDGAALIATENINLLSDAEGGAGGKFSFVCSNNFSVPSEVASQTMPSCDGSVYEGTPEAEDFRVVLEMNVKFAQCWNGNDPSNWNNFIPSPGGWYLSQCNDEYSNNLPNLEYFVNYVVEPGETTDDWFLASDVDPTTFGVAKAENGSSIHGDWWGAWHKETAELWIDNCVNFVSDVPTGCGFGFLTDGGPDNTAPVEGPALKLRPQYLGPQKIPAELLFDELCPASGRDYRKPEDAAHCVPGTGY